MSHIVKAVQLVVKLRNAQLFIITEHATIKLKPLTI